MDRMGLVSQVEAELERMISLDRLPADGSLPSEGALARRYGVSRGTLREALLRLSARGLVVQHPGRRTRAVALDESVTLENLSVALHGKGQAHPERWRLLEGFFALKREVTVELLAACCEQACKADLDRLEEACFALREAARWNEEGSGWAQQEFTLLRLAAHVADRPGHLLLIHSLERSFWAMEGRVAPHLDAEAVQAWAQCALYALGEKNAQALRRELPPLLQACEERLFGTPEPASQETGTREALSTAPGEPDGGGEPRPEAAKEAPPDAAAPNLSGCRTALCHAPPAEASPPDAPSSGGCQELEYAAAEVGGPQGREERGGHMPPSARVVLGCEACAAPRLSPGSRLPGQQPMPPTGPSS